jgi:transcriptional regulator with XRE-family HTH domain
MKSELNISIGQRIRTLRLNKGISQEKLAELADLHRTYIGMIERGDKAVTIITLKKLSLALNVSINELVKDL